jgi:hypothetical protein
MSETESNSKREQILEEVRETPGKKAAEIAESVGCSPAIVGRVIEANAGAMLREMRDARLQAHVDDLHWIEYDVLWMVAEEPDARSDKDLTPAYREALDDDIGRIYPGERTDKTYRVSTIWSALVDVDWAGRQMVAGKIHDLLDEDEVSDAAKEAVEKLRNGDITTDEDTEPTEGTIPYIRSEIARKLGREEDAKKHLEGEHSQLTKDELLVIVDAFDIDIDEEAGIREIRPKIAEELGLGSDGLWNDKDLRFTKEGLEATRDALEDALEDEDEKPECQYCGDTFKSKAGRGKHEKHCGENPENEDKRDTGGRKRDVKVADEKRDLTNTNIETLETIADEEIEDIEVLASELDMSYQGVASRLQSIRQRGWRVASDALFEDAQRILDETEQDEPGVTVEHGGSSTQDVLAAGEEDRDVDEDQDAENDKLDDTLRIKNEDDYVDLTEECMSEHTEREATVPNDTLVDSVLRVDEDIVRRLRHTGAAVAEIDGEVVRLEVV